jgi:hypothetical protein
MFEELQKLRGSRGGGLRENGDRGARGRVLSYRLEEIDKLSASEPAIHKEVRNCSFYFFCFLGGVTGLLAPRPPP